MDIDRATFAPERYFEDLLGRLTLRQLLHTDEALLKEIKKLDSDMKTLVYENYNKFISATDTIRDMKSNVENMEEEMQRLSDNLDKITFLTQSINTTLAPRRTKVQELSGVYRLLKQRQFLFELPTRLKRALEMGSYNQAVVYYTRTKSVLQKYRTVPSFLAILRECDEIMTTLRLLLHSKIKADEALPEVVEAANLLLDLGETPIELGRSFVMARARTLKQRLVSFEGELSTITVVDVPAHSQQATLEAFVQKVHGQFLGEALQLCEAFRSMFIHRLPPADRRGLLQILEDLGREISAQYFSLMCSALLTLCIRSVDSLVEVLRFVQRDLLQAHSRTPELGLADVARDLAHDSMHKLLKFHFKRTKRGIEDHIQRLAESCGRDESSSSQVGTAQCKDLAKRMVAEIEHFVENFGVLFDARHDDEYLTGLAGLLLTKIDVNTQQLLLYINLLVANHYEETGTGLAYSREHKIPPIVALELARVCSDLENFGIPHLHENLTKLYSNLGSSVMLNSTDLARQMGQSSRKLLAHYVKTQGHKLSQMIRKCVETPNWLSTREPRGVRPAVEMLIAEIASVSQEVGQVFDPEPERSSSNPVPRTRARYDTHIGSLFEKKIQIFSPVAPDLDSILMAIVKISLKSLFECVRLQTFSKHGYQQLQVDVCYLRQELLPYAHREETLFLRLADEVLTSAADRCTDPSPVMEPGILELLCKGSHKG